MLLIVRQRTLTDTTTTMSQGITRQKIQATLQQAVSPNMVGKGNKPVMLWICLMMEMATGIGCGRMRAKQTGRTELLDSVNALNDGRLKQEGIANTY